MLSVYSCCMKCTLEPCYYRQEARSPSKMSTCQIVILLTEPEGKIFFFHRLFDMLSSPVLLGLSLKTQVLTAIFLTVRLYCSFIMEADIHTVLDFITLVATLWVIYMMKFKLKASYMADLDNLPLYYTVNTISHHSIYSVHDNCLRRKVLYMLLSGK